MVVKQCHKAGLRQGYDEGMVNRGTYGHIQSAACLATKKSVTVAHNKCLNELIDAIIKPKKKKSKIVFIKEDTDVSFKTAWQTSALQQVCTVQQMEQAAMQTHQELNSNEGQDRHLSVEEIETLWRQRPDRMAINS